MDQRLVKQLKEAMPTTYHPQYNWDLSKDVAEDDLELFKQAMTNCPAGQDNNTYFKVIFIWTCGDGLAARASIQLLYR